MGRRPVTSLKGFNLCIFSWIDSSLSSTLLVLVCLVFSTVVYSLRYLVKGPQTVCGPSINDSDDTLLSFSLSFGFKLQENETLAKEKRNIYKRLTKSFRAKSCQSSAREPIFILGSWKRMSLVVNIHATRIKSKKKATKKTAGQDNQFGRSDDVQTTCRILLANDFSIFSGGIDRVWGRSLDTERVIDRWKSLLKWIQISTKLTWMPCHQERFHLDSALCCLGWTFCGKRWLYLLLCLTNQTVRLATQFRFFR